MNGIEKTKELPRSDDSFIPLLLKLPLDPSKLELVRKLIQLNVLNVLVYVFRRNEESENGAS